MQRGFGIVDFVESVHLLVKSQPMSEKLNARLGNGYVTADSIARTLRPWLLTSI